MINYKIINKLWFTPLTRKVVGIITIEFTHNDQVYQKAYIGIADGNDEESDAEFIVSTGARFHGFSADSIMKRLTNEMG